MFKNIKYASTHHALNLFALPYTGNLGKKLQKPSVYPCQEPGFLPELSVFFSFHQIEIIFHSFIQ